MTTEIRRVVMQLALDRSFVRWLAFAATVAAALIVNAPIGGGSGV
jgi:hypothetical protein